MGSWDCICFGTSYFKNILSTARKYAGISLGSSDILGREYFSAFPKYWVCPAKDSWRHLFSSSLLACRSSSVLCNSSWSHCRCNSISLSSFWLSNSSLFSSFWHSSSARGDQKVLQFPTLTNKLVKMSCWLRIVKCYIVITFWKNDASISLWHHRDVIVSTFSKHENLETWTSCSYKVFV